MKKTGIAAVIFDMYETLITHYESPLYFGSQMAADAGIPEEKFLELWRSTDVGRILRTFKIKKNVEVTDNGKIII